jgi:tetratricopeptide (TPR) repeat protein
MIKHSKFLRGIIGPARMLAVMALVLTPLVCPMWQPGCLAQDKPLDADIFRIQAEMHHNLALHYLEKGDVDKAMAEARQIIQPVIPPLYEDAVCKSTMIIAEELGSMRRFNLCQNLLDEALKAVTQVSSRIILLKDKSRLYFLAGETDKALDAMKRAKDLEAQRK